MKKEKYDFVIKLPDTLESTVGIIPICRRCDLPMRYEGENPKKYLLYSCPNCNNKTGLRLNIGISDQELEYFKKLFKK